MSPQLDVYTTAKRLIKQHGEHAAILAARRAYQMRARGDQRSAAMWFEIRDTIRLLTDQRKPGSDTTMH